MIFNKIYGILFLLFFDNSELVRNQKTSLEVLI